MPMQYAHTAIPDAQVPRAAFAFAQHMLDTYASETSKVATVWRDLGDADLEFRPHPRSSTVADVLRHQLLSERRFFGEFLGTPEPPPERVLPEPFGVEPATARLVELALPRLRFLADQPQEWWMETVPFFDVRRERAWVFWRRVLHTAHHRTQLTVWLRLMDRPVPPTYGPTADVRWSGADPTHTVDAAGRR
jgi:uncharacterized damage-inducible protein DinB